MRTADGTHDHARPRATTRDSGGPSRPPLSRWSRSSRQQSLEERAIALEGAAQIIGRDVVPPIPLALQPAARVGERLGQVLHQLGHKLVGLLHRLTRRVDKADLHVGPAHTEALRVLTRQQGLGRDTNGASGASYGAGIRLGTVTGLSDWLLVACALACLVAVVGRFRRARGMQRQQLKWFAYGAVALLVSFIGLLPLAWAGLFALILVGFGLFTGCITMAMVRYHLYDIDRLINRTLVYGLLTALLAGVYAIVVLVLGLLFGGIRGQPPSWVVAGATLAVAALFQPARHRIQQVVDRRFNRRNYDAAKTVEAFSVRLRDEIDLDSLSAELLAVVNQTMQPTQVSLWLRPAPMALRAHLTVGQRLPPEPTQRGDLHSSCCETGLLKCQTTSETDR